MSSYKLFFSLKVLKQLLKNFVDVFLVLYFLNVAENNILPLGIYKFVAILAIYSVIFLTRNLCKSKHRVELIRIGILIDFVYFMTIILLREKVVDYIYLVGLLYGLEEGFYYSIYNNLESSAITNSERAKFTGNYTAVKSILSVIFPLIFGNIIYQTGFIKTLGVVLIVVVFQIFLSFLIKDRNIPKGEKTDFKAFRDAIKDNKEIAQVFKTNIFYGLTYSEGAFSYIVTIYIAKVFSDSVSLGIFTSIFSLISCGLGLLFARIIKPKHYNNVIKISMTLTILSLCIMISGCNMLTIILFNLCQTFSKELISLINSNSQSNISNLEVVKNKFKVEYWLGIETSLVIGRIVSNGLFILMAYTGSDIMIYTFTVFLALFAFNSTKLQNTIKENSKPINTKPLEA